MHRALLALALVPLALAAGAALSARTVTRPDPSAQAQLDGCRRDLAGLVTSQVPTWAYVNDKDAPAGGPPPEAQWVRGVVEALTPAFLASHPSGVDDPFTHDSYDFNINVRVDPAFASLLGGDEAAHTGNFEGAEEETGRLHVERESAAFPSFAWPEAGDRVAILGSWVWDCGHWAPGGERTELHPFRAVWVQRNPTASGSGPSPRSPLGEAEGDLFISTDKTPAGIQADCAHRTKGDRTAFKACLAAEPNWQDASGSYTFFLPVPPQPAPGARLRVRVVDRGSTPGAPNPELDQRDSGFDVTLSISPQLTAGGKRLVVAKQVFVGWSPMPAAALPEHLRLHFQQLVVRRAMDPGCQPAGCHSVETTQADQISKPPGEYVLYWDVAGIWGTWRPLVLLVHDGQVVPGRQTVDFYVARGSPWRLFTFARECDFGGGSFSDRQRPPWPCPKSGEFGSAAGDDVPGAVVEGFGSPQASLGEHRSNALLAGSSCPPANKQGCYALGYAVTLVDDAAERAARSR